MLAQILILLPQVFLVFFLNNSYEDPMCLIKWQLSIIYRPYALLEELLSAVNGLSGTLLTKLLKTAHWYRREPNSYW